MRLTTVSCWQLLKHSRLGETSWRATSMKFLCSHTTITSSASWIRKAWAPDKSDRLKSCQDTTSGLIIDRAKLMELLILCLDISSGLLKKKRPFKSRIQKSYTNCNPRWLGCLDWVSRKWAFWEWNSRCCPPCTKFTSVGQSSYCSYASFRTLFEAS